MATKAITDGEFETVVSDGASPVLVDFWAEWCNPCRSLGPKLEEISDEMGDKVQIVKLNIDENPATAQKFGIRSIPTMLIFKGGEKVDQLVGNLAKEDIVTSIEKHI